MQTMLKCWQRPFVRNPRLQIKGRWASFLDNVFKDSMQIPNAAFLMKILNSLRVFNTKNHNVTLWLCLPLSRLFNSGNYMDRYTRNKHLNSQFKGAPGPGKTVHDVLLNGTTYVVLKALHAEWGRYNRNVDVHSTLFIQSCSWSTQNNSSLFHGSYFSYSSHGLSVPETKYCSRASKISWFEDCLLNTSWWKCTSYLYHDTL